MPRTTLVLEHDRETSSWALYSSGRNRTKNRKKEGEREGQEREEEKQIHTNK